jgi:hypothetical protein
MAKALRKPQEEETRSYVERIRDLVEYDYVPAARRLVAEAIQQGEQDEALLHWQRVLGPAKFLESRDEREPDRTPEFDWLRAHGRDYRGQWVALAENGLLAHSKDVHEVEAAVEAMTLTRRPLLHFIEPPYTDRYSEQPRATRQALRKLDPDTRSYEERIRELVEQDYVGGARKLLAEALEKGDHGEDLSGWQQVLAPAKVLRVGGPKDIDRTPDVEWIRQNSEEYRGQWVALLHGELLAHSESLKDVLAILKQNETSHPPLLHHID